jgi:uncharacterized membrane protein YozB (DUF420 family)
MDHRRRFDSNHCLHSAIRDFVDFYTRRRQTQPSGTSCRLSVRANARWGTRSARPMNVPTITSERGAAQGLWFFPAMALVTLFAVLVGFGRTYGLPVARGTFDGPVSMHIHGVFTLAWVMLFVGQIGLVRTRRIRQHRKLGRFGLPIAGGVLITMIPAGVFMATREAASGLGATGISTLLGVFTSGALFVALVTAGIIARRNREAHSRWMLLATLVLLWPAWYRFRHWFPGVPHPEFWFALVLPYIWIAVAAVRDRLTRGAVHPVLAIGGGAVVLEQTLEAILFDSAPWRTTAHVLYGWLQALPL